MVLKLIAVANASGAVAAAADTGLSTEFSGFAGIFLTAMGALWASNRTSKSSDRGTALGEAKSLWSRNDQLERRLRKYEAALTMHEVDRRRRGLPAIPRPEGLYDDESA